MIQERQDEFGGWRTTLREDRLPAGYGLQDKDASWDRLFSRLHPTPKKRFAWYRLAAAVLLGGVLILTYYYIVHPGRDIGTNYASHVPPGGPDSVVQPENQLRTEVSQHPAARELAVRTQKTPHQEAGERPGKVPLAGSNHPIRPEGYEGSSRHAGFSGHAGDVHGNGQQDPGHVDHTSDPGLNKQVASFQDPAVYREPTAFQGPIAIKTDSALIARKDILPARHALRVVHINELDNYPGAGLSVTKKTNSRKFRINLNDAENSTLPEPDLLSTSPSNNHNNSNSGIKIVISPQNH